MGLTFPFLLFFARVLGSGVIFNLGSSSSSNATPHTTLDKEGVAATHTVFYLFHLIFASRYSRSQGAWPRGEDVSAEAAAWWDDLAVLRSFAARRPHRLPRL
jgi:hypothetical protein